MVDVSAVALILFCTIREVLMMWEISGGQEVKDGGL